MKRIAALALACPDGHPVTNLDPGSYTLLVHDRWAIHNFHLFGPGGVGDQTFTVNLVAGRCTFVCDAHPSMRGRSPSAARRPQRGRRQKKKH